MFSNDEWSPTLFPLFVYWPIDKNIPEELDYSFCFNSFIPDSYVPSRLDSEFIEEWISYLSGRNRVMLALDFKEMDSRLNYYCPIGNFSINYTTASGFRHFNVGSNGHIILYDLPSVSSSITINFKNDDFQVYRDSTSIIYSSSTGPLSSYSHDGFFYHIRLPNSFFVDVFRAAYYYYCGNNDLLDSSTKYSADVLDIFAKNYADTIHHYRGQFMANGDDLHIDIYNPPSYPGTSSDLFGTVFHELGHATHFATNGMYNMYYTASFIQESFANFYGWYNVLEYYNSIIIEQYLVNAICSQGFQDWWQGEVYPYIVYTPIFIDLFDDYNQGVIIDDVSGVPVDKIASVALGSMNYSGLMNRLYDLCLEGEITNDQWNNLYGLYDVFN